MAISNMANTQHQEMLKTKQLLNTAQTDSVAKSRIGHESEKHQNLPEDVNGNDQQQNNQTWPFASGFETDYEQRTSVELTVTGKIPAYAAGTLYRTGPGNYKLDGVGGGTLKMHHWFDGFTTVHRFNIREAGPGLPVSVFYNSRRTVDKLIEQIRQNGRYKDFSFAQKRDPCQSFFRKLMSTFVSTLDRSGSLEAENIGVTLSADMPGIGPTGAVSGSHSSNINSLITKTDANMYQRLDPETLEPTGICSQTILHPELKGPLSAAHAKTCPKTGDIFNYNLQFGSKPMYRVFQVSAKTGETSILAKIKAPGAYLHSLILTPSTVILCVWNSHFAMGGVSILYNRNVLDSILPLDPSKKALWYVIDRTPARRGLLATYETPPFFCFHTINAFEESSTNTPGQVDIVADLVTYRNLDILHRFYYENLMSEVSGADSYKSRNPESTPLFARYRLQNVPLNESTKPQIEATSARPGLSETQANSKIGFELPTINPRFSTLPYRWVYGVSDQRDSNFFDGLIKFDTQQMTCKRWSRHGHTAGEPIFVANPDGADEDDGVLLSVVLDGFAGHSYLLCLDARDMSEMGRAEVPGIVGFGFHGLHVPSKRKDVYAGGD